MVLRNGSSLALSTLAPPQAKPLFLEAVAGCKFGGSPGMRSIEAPKFFFFFLEVFLMQTTRFDTIVGELAPRSLFCG